MLYNIIIAVITLICVLLTLVILLQNGQGQGLSGIASAGAGGMGGSAGLGARRTADLLSKATSVLGGVFLVLCILANFAIDRNTAPQNSVLEQGAPLNNIAVPSQTQPAVPSQTPPPPVNNDGGSDDSEN